MENLNERDYIEFESEDGDTIRLDVIEYFEHKGNEYVILSDMSQLEEHDFDNMSEEEIEEVLAAQEFYILQVITKGDMEEFVEPDEAIMDELVGIAEEILNSGYELDEEHDEDCGCGCSCKE